MKYDGGCLGFGLLVKLLSVTLLMLVLISENAVAWPAVATEENLRNAILEKNIGEFTSVELEEMDLNKDGVLDVADVIYYLKTEEIERPIITFDVRQTEAYEGAGDIEVQMSLSMAYSGQVKYRENGVEKTIVVPETQGALIIIANPDDGIRSNTAKMVDLELLYDADLNYVPGVESLHSVVIHENDSLWNGTIHNDVYTNLGDDLMDTSIDIHFQLEIIQNGGLTTASVYTDGNGIIPRNGDSETWPMANVSFSETNFVADVLNMNSGHNNFNVDFLRHLHFESAFEDQSIEPFKRSMISGQVTESLQSSQHPFFERSVTGSFILIKIDSTVSSVSEQ